MEQYEQNVNVVRSSAKMLKTIGRTELVSKCIYFDFSYMDFLDQGQIQKISEQKQENEKFLNLSPRVLMRINVRFENKSYKCAFSIGEKQIKVSLGKDLVYALSQCYATTLMLVAGHSKAEVKEIYGQEPDMQETFSYWMDSVQNCLMLEKGKVYEGALAGLFQRLVNRRAYTLVGGSGEEKKALNKIIFASDWMEAKELEHYKGEPNCIYYLTREQDVGAPALLYVGMAKVLGGRLTIKKGGYIGHPLDKVNYRFTHFRFDQLAPDAAPKDLEYAEEALIGGLLQCSDRFPNGFVMTNDRLNKAYGSLRTAKVNTQL